MLDPGLDILVVEDDPVVRRMVGRLLRQLGLHHVRAVADGKAALEAMAQQTPQVVITDWNMPTVSGFQLLRAMRGHEALKAIPVLMITSRAKRDAVIMARQEGVNAYLVKPFDAATLAAKLRTLLPAPGA